MNNLNDINAIIDPKKVGNKYVNQKNVIYANRAIIIKIKKAVLRFASVSKKLFLKEI